MFLVDFSVVWDVILEILHISYAPAEGGWLLQSGLSRSLR